MSVVEVGQLSDAKLRMVIPNCLFRFVLVRDLDLSEPLELATAVLAFHASCLITWPLDSTFFDKNCQL